jgi:hypothetical protein
MKSLGKIAKKVSLSNNSLMRNQYKILSEKYSLVKEDGRENMTNDTISDVGQYGDSGMERVISLLLIKYNGKVSRDYLDWIKNNFNEFFVGHNPEEYSDSSLDFWFEFIVHMKMDDTDEEEKKPQDWVKDDILNDLEEYYQEYKNKKSLEGLARIRTKQ